MRCRALLVGCGNMGSAMLRGWLAEGLAATDIKVVEPNTERADLALEHGVTVLSEPKSLGTNFLVDAIIFAVKPQAMEAIVPLYSNIQGRPVFISIGAGKQSTFFERLLGQGAAVVRSMPNTPSLVRRGIAVAYANGNVQFEQRRLCTDLLEAIGEVAWVDDENLMDAVTAVSGSGPAYVFLLIECLTQAGVEAGLSVALANQLALSTVAGAGELARKVPESPADLRKQVTSPGGTTEAALEILMEPRGLQTLMTRAVAAAAKRSRELAG